MNPFEWLARRSAEKATAECYGVSRAFVLAIVRNNDDVVAGRISHEEWQARALMIAMQYPEDQRRLNYVCGSEC
jgi:hypothetical protein